MQPHTARPQSPHIRSATGPIIDFNGTGIWSVEGLRVQYQSLAVKLQVEPRANLVPSIYREGERIWIYPVVDSLYPLVKAGDAAATEIGVHLIEEDAFFCFGTRLKITMARSLRQGKLSLEQQQRIRKRIVTMLLTNNVPEEFREYRRLLRHVGVAEFWPALDAQVDRANPYVMRHYIWLDQYARTKI